MAMNCVLNIAPKMLFYKGIYRNLLRVKATQVVAVILVSICRIFVIGNHVNKIKITDGNIYIEDLPPPMINIKKTKYLHNDTDFCICYYLHHDYIWRVNLLLSSAKKEARALSQCCEIIHDDVIKWKHFPRYWPFVRGIHRSPVNSRRKGQWNGALIFF